MYFYTFICMQRGCRVSILGDAQHSTVHTVLSFRTFPTCENLISMRNNARLMKMLETKVQNYSSTGFCFRLSCLVAFVSSCCCASFSAVPLFGVTRDWSTGCQLFWFSFFLLDLLVSSTAVSRS